jgi:hypothetical protein
VGILGHRVYRVWIGMLMDSDDDGRVVADPAQLRARIFPFRTEVSVAHIKRDMRELARRKLIRLYQRNGTQYAVFPSWKDWQHPKYPVPSKLPPPPMMEEDSPRTSPVVGKSSPLSSVVRSRMGSSRVERKRRTVSHDTHDRPAPITDELRAQLKAIEDRNPGLGRV